MIIEALLHPGKCKPRGDGARKGDVRDKRFRAIESLSVVTTYKASKQHQPQGSVLGQIRNTEWQVATLEEN